MQQPQYHLSEHKTMARKENVAIYRRITNRGSIPRGRGYWTLCNRQPQLPGAEIVQMVECGLINKNQFYGVDRDAEIIKQNRLWHPEAHWINGDWVEVVEDCEYFKPAIVYLDTTSFADHWVAARMLLRTMMICPRQTLLLVNVMLNDPRSRRKFDSNVLIDNIVKNVPKTEIDRWKREIANYNYSATGKTVMQTCVLYKG